MKYKNILKNCINILEHAEISNSEEVFFDKIFIIKNIRTSYQKLHEILQHKAELENNKSFRINNIPSRLIEETLSIGTCLNLQLDIPKNKKTLLYIAFKQSLNSCFSYIK